MPHTSLTPMLEAPAKFVRLEGWETRVRAVLEAARFEPYALGQNDCLRLACATIHALTGVDLWPNFAGRYATRAQSLRCIAEYGGNFQAGVARILGGQPEPMSVARPGDICEYREPDITRMPHLGVVWDAKAVAVLGEQGLLFVARGACQHCWRIG